jgi:DNA-directed RNA polymerase specialized sigma24 family protein
MVEAAEVVVGHRDSASTARTSAVPLDGFLGRSECFLKEHLAEFSRRYLAHRPRSLIDPDDLVNDVSHQLLADESIRSGGFGRGLRPFLAYLRQTAVRCAISAERRELGRMRCGNCRHFAPYSGLCLKLGHPWTHTRLDAVTDPRALEPACQSFTLRREPTALGEEWEMSAAMSATPDVASLDGEVAAMVHQSLLELAERHPRAALIVRARLIEQRTYETLAGLGPSIRTMKRDYALGIAFLRRKLASLAPEDMAPDAELGRSSTEAES